MSNYWEEKCITPLQQNKQNKQTTSQEVKKSRRINLFIYFVELIQNLI